MQVRIEGIVLLKEATPTIEFMNRNIIDAIFN